MDGKVAGILLLGLGLVVLGAAGVAGGEQDRTTPEVELQDPAGVTVADGVEDADGTVQAIVALERLDDGPDRSTSDNGPGSSAGERSGSGEERATVADLQSHAAASQQPLTDFAAVTEGVSVENTFWITNAAVVTLDTTELAPRDLAQVAGVEAIVPDFEVEPLETTAGSTSDGHAPARNPGLPVDSGPVGPAGPTLAAGDDPMPEYDTTYGLDHIGATDVWDEHGTQGEGVTVTVLDTGIDADHPDLDLVEWQEFDDDGNKIDSDPFDEGDHGTHVSGTVAGGDGSGTHVGVAPGVELHHGGVLTDSSGTFSAVVGGIQWAVEEDADVVTMSLGVQDGGFINMLLDPIYNAENAGTTVIGSSGNCGPECSSTPGNTWDGIGVGASNDEFGIRSSSSGQVVDTDDDWSSPPEHYPGGYVIPAVAAPGASVYSTEPGDDYGYKSGTSMAAPHVAGAVALIEGAVDRELSPGEIKDALEETAWKPADWDEPEDERDIRYGSGIIDVPAAIDSLEGYQSETVVDFNWETSCPDESVSDLDLYFSGDISSSDDDFHVDDASGADEDPPDGGCVLRSEGESATIDSTPGGQSADLDYYPSRGDGITFDQYAHNIRTGIGGGDGADFEFRFGVQDADNYYYVRTEVDDEPFELVLGYVSGGTDISLDATDIEGTVDDGVFQTMDIEWGTGDSPSTIEATYAGSETVSATSTLYDEGGVGFQRVGTQGSVYSYTHLVDSVDATVREPYFQVDITDYDSSVDPGETAEITAEITNQGGLEHSEWVDLLVDGDDADFSWVTLEGGYHDNWDSTTETFELETEDGDPYTVSPELCAMDSGNCDQVTITVGADPEPDLQIESLDVPDTVDIEETLEVGYTIENVGGETGEESFVDLLVDGSDSTYDDTHYDVTVDPGETESDTLVFDEVDEYFDVGETISYTVELVDFDDTQSETTTVTGEADIAIQSMDHDEEIAIEDDLVVEYTLVNNGGEDHTIDWVDLLIDGALEEMESDVTVEAGETVSGTHVYEDVEANHEPGETLDTAIRLWDTDEDWHEETLTDSVEILPDDAPELIIDSLDYPESVAPGEDLEIQYTLENVGEEPGTEDAVQLLVDGVLEDSDENVDLDPGETESGTLVFDDVENYDGESITVQTESAARTDGATTATEEATASPDIDPTLRDASGETDALVYLEPAAVTDSMDSDIAVETLQSQADATQDVATADLERMAGVEVGNSFWLVNAIAVTYDAATVDAHDLAEVEHAVAVYENAEIERPEPIVDEDPVGPTTVGDVTYGIDQINADTLWDVHDTQGEDTTIVIQDNGFDLDHEALAIEAAHLIDGSGDIVGDPEVGDHGTHVAGTAAGGQDPDGIHIGVAPDTELHVHDIFSAGGTTGASIGSIEIAVEEDAVAVSGSWGGGCHDDYPDPVYYGQMIDPIDNARTLGTEVVASSGNAGDCIGGFSNDQESFGVGASDQSEDITDFSSGSVIDKDDGQPNYEEAGGFDDPPAEWEQSWIEPRVAAPGQWVYSALPGDDYTDSYSGTSMATPHVPGAIALIESATEESFTGPEIREALEETAWKPDDWDPDAYAGDIWTDEDSTMDQPGIDSRYGYGIIDVMAAYDYLVDQDDVISFTVELDSFGDSQSGQVDIVEADADVTIQSIDPDDEVAVDETLTVEYTLANDGTADHEVDAVDLLADGTTADTDSAVTVSAGETATGTLTFEDVDDYDDGDTIPVTVILDDVGEDWDGTSESDSVSVLGPEADLSSASVAGQETTPTVSVGTDADATVAVENVGGAAGSFTVDFLIVNGEEYVERSQTTDALGPGETDTLTFESVTGDLPVGEDYWADFLVDGSGIPLDLTVEEPDVDFTVDIVDTTTPVAGEPLDVTVDIHNEGTDEATQTVELAIDGLGSDSTSVSLGGGGTDQETLSVGTEAGDADSYTATVSSADDTDSTTVEVQEPAHFAVDIQGATTAQSQTTVTYEVTNEGAVADEQTVAFEVDGDQEAERTHDLDGEESETDSFTYDIEAGDAPEVEFEVSSEDDSDTLLAAIDPASLDIDVLAVDDPVIEGDTLTVTVEATNVGDEPADETVELLDEGDLLDAHPVSLPGETSGETILEWTTSAGDSETDSLTLDSDTAEEQTVPVEVQEPASFEVEILDTSEPHAGDSLEVTVAVSNVGDIEATSWVELEAGTLTTAKTNVTLGGGNETNETLSVDTTLDDVGDLTLNATSKWDSTAGIASVALPPIVGDHSPKDSTGDGLYDNIRGDDDVGIFDVQGLYSNLDHPVIETYPEKFNFQGDNEDVVTIFDVQALFDLVSA